MPTSQNKITIVGSGLVGSLLALLLKKRGFDVEVFEKRADPRLASAGAGRSINLVITSRGLYALELAGLSEEVRALAVPVYGRMMHSVSGETVFQAYGQENEFNLSISRDALNRFLISRAEQAGVEFTFEHEITDLDPSDKSVIFNHSLTMNYEVLIGADGAGSRVRKALASEGLITERTDWLEADYKELTLPLSRDGRAQLQTDALHIWPRGDHMMMALANKDGSFTVTLYLPKRSFENLKSRAQVEDLFTREFRDAIPMMPQYAEEFLAHPQGTLGTVRASKWVAGEVALIGDAAHAIVPFFGQGMNCGFEDCSALMSLIDSHLANLVSKLQSSKEVSSSKSSSATTEPALDWSEILGAYERERKANANAIADMALENWVEMRDKVADQKFLLRKKVEGLLEKRHPSVYKSRYGLITYTLVPYKLAQDAGRLQDEMFMELLNSVSSVEQVDWSHADRLMDSCWIPFLKRHNLKIEKYPE